MSTQVRLVTSQATGTQRLRVLHIRPILRMHCKTRSRRFEAVIGDPPKNSEKFFGRIRGLGIDPHEPVGYENQVPISTLIRQMNEARDKRSAHGSTRRRTIRPAELLDFQACADVLVLAAVEKARGSSVLA